MHNVRLDVQVRCLRSAFLDKMANSACMRCRTIHVWKPVMRAFTTMQQCVSLATRRARHAQGRLQASVRPASMHAQTACVLARASCCTLSTSLAIAPRATRSAQNHVMGLLLATAFHQPLHNNQHLHASTCHLERCASSSVPKIISVTLTARVCLVMTTVIADARGLAWTSALNASMHRSTTRVLQSVRHHTTRMRMMCASRAATRARTHSARGLTLRIASPTPAHLLVQADRHWIAAPVHAMTVLGSFWLQESAWRTVLQARMLTTSTA